MPFETSRTRPREQRQAIGLLRDAALKETREKLARMAEVWQMRIRTRRRPCTGLAFSQAERPGRFPTARPELNVRPNRRGVQMAFRGVSASDLPRIFPARVSEAPEGVSHAAKTRL